jgi:hypothetical protein
MLARFRWAGDPLREHIVKFPTLLLLVCCPPVLSGCVPMMAVSAASMAAQAAQGSPTSNESLQPRAREACSAQAAQYGAVHVIDVEQHSVAKIIVWGTIDDGKQKQSFQCDFGTKISGFKLRPIHAER